MSKTKLWVTAKDYIFITLGIALYAFGFSAFIFPEQVVIGGLAGVGTIVYFLTGIPVAISQFAINMALLMLAYRIVGRQFVLGTIYGATMISVFVGIFTPLFEGGFTHEPFMNITIGGVLCGLGIGTAFVHNGSSGGTDIIAAMASKKSNVSIGRMMLYTDVVIISSSFFLFHHLDKMVFGFVVLFLVSYMADLVVNTNRQAVQFTIFSRHWQEIATAINNDAHRGCQDSACDVPQDRVGDNLAHHQVNRPRRLCDASQRQRRLRQGLRRTESEDCLDPPQAGIEHPGQHRQRRPRRPPPLKQLLCLRLSLN